MRRKRSDELPRYRVEPTDPLAVFQWPRRSRVLAVVGLLLLFWLVHSRTGNKDSSHAAVQWDKYAYSLYATDSATLCHAVIVFDALAKFGSKADRVLFYPEYWDTLIASSKDRDSQLLVMARDKYKVKLNPIKLLTVEGLRTPDAPKRTWDKSVTKFMAFGLTQYSRVIAIDSDIALLQNLDELFLLPPAPIAMPGAYWYDSTSPPMTSLLMVLQPSLTELTYFKETISHGGDSALIRENKYDMELVNERFGSSALVLPHRPYALLTGELRSHNHTAYLGTTSEPWDPDKVMKEAKMVHFSDWPLPKPWVMWPQEGLAEMQPDCGGSKEGTCRERVLWKGLYEGFRERRRNVCKLLSVPAPDWEKLKSGVVAGNGTRAVSKEEKRS